MPIYEYICAPCDQQFDALQAMNARGADCPSCAEPARRIISTFSAVTEADGGELSSVAGMGGCACCSGGACSCACG